MSAALIESIIVYALIPIYIGGLLILVFFIARSELGASLLPGEERKMKLSDFSLGTYILTAVLFGLVLVLAILTRKRSYER